MAVASNLTSRAGPRWQVGAALTAVSLAPVLVYTWVVGHRIGYPFELEWMEGGSAGLADRVAQGRALYQAPTVDFTPWPYPPLYPALGASLNDLTGSSLLSLRVISVLASAVVLVLLGLLVWWRTRFWGAAAAAAGVYAATYFVGGAWADTARVDSLLLALSLAGVAVASVARTWRGGIVVGLVLFAAAATKQNALVVALAVLVWMLCYRRVAGITAGVVLGVTVAAGLAIGQVVTVGWFIDYVVLELPGHPLDLTRLWSFWVVDLLVPLAPAAALVAMATVQSRRGADLPTASSAGRTGAQWLLPAAAAGLALAGWVGRLHTGGAANTLMPAYAAAALVTGLAVARLAAGSARMQVGVVLAVAVQVAVLSRTPSSAIPSAADEAAGHRVVAALAELPGRVIMLDHPSYLALAGKPSNGHVVAVTDLLRGRPGRAQDWLRADLERAVGEANVIVLDRAGDASLFEPALTADFELAPRADGRDSPTEVTFVPVGGYEGRPTLVFVRRGVDVTGIDLTALQGGP